jgi:ribosomal protein L37AE/L43A
LFLSPSFFFKVEVEPFLLFLYKKRESSSKTVARNSQFYLQIFLNLQSKVMASTPSPSSPKLASFIRGTQTPNDIQKKLRMKKYKSMEDIMARARYVVVEKEDYSNTMCEQCGSGDNPEEIMLCDKCDNGFHMKCVRPIVVRIPIGPWICFKCSGTKKVTGRRLIHF